LIQLTGKSNYQKVTDIHNQKSPEDQQDFVANPDLLTQNVRYAIESGFIWWHMNGMNDKANDTGDDAVRTVTLKVNGGTIGLADRKEKFGRLIKHMEKT
jgi:predicted chitinase